VRAALIQHRFPGIRPHHAATPRAPFACPNSCHPRRRAQREVKRTSLMIITGCGRSAIATGTDSDGCCAPEGCAEAGELTHRTRGTASRVKPTSSTVLFGRRCGSLAVGREPILAASGYVERQPRSMTGVCKGFTPNLEPCTCGQAAIDDSSTCRGSDLAASLAVIDTRRIG
jgi:hypothetical protein